MVAANALRGSVLSARKANQAARLCFEKKQRRSHDRHFIPDSAKIRRKLAGSCRGKSSKTKIKAISAFNVTTRKGEGKDTKIWTS